ncbi:hypothetical protein RM844_20095 [Streptomyces sp. DSM 44915]|uniref:Uncharacterized protein n=1 Tax=Streptomyces chisholmiae TaxID=3075540 RepID=A0ABU2JUC3_9ACTN|nr:hypothetical protein [Streptomyces sp. DSM 44915]MDT0268591.1 hypothetical protein [Streptomyces sp. DSM 44915]
MTPEHRPPVPPLVTRRTLLLGAGATALAAAVPLVNAPAARADLATVPTLPAEPDRSLFAPHEQIFAGYLKILAPMANDIVTDGTERHGWMAGGWWRTPSEPFNARVMEHVATLAWFLANDRPWNPYHQNTALRARLEAAVDYYLGLQHADGSFPEYAATEHGLAPTGFGTVALSRALVEMRAAGTDYDQRTRMREAIAASSAWLLDTSRSAPWSDPIGYANQTAAGLAGAAAAAQALGDDALLATVRDRVVLLGQRGQAPGGWFYEARGFDSGYNANVQLPDLGELQHRIGGTELASQVTRWTDFFQYTCVREPGAGGFIRMAAASSRTVSGTPLLDTAPDTSDSRAFASQFLAAQPKLAAFLTSREERAAERAAWAASTAPVPARAKQDTSPRLWMHVSQAPQGPTQAQKDAAFGLLSHLRSSRWTRLRSSPVLDTRFVFVRRPRYYAGALFGQRASSRVSHGLQLLWHPAMGTVAVGLNNGAGNEFWATVLDAGGDDARQATTAASLTPTFLTTAGATIPADDVDAVSGDFRIRQTASHVDVATTTTFTDTGLRREVTAGGAATEMVPLVLRPDDALAFTGSNTPVAYNTGASADATGFTISRAGVTATFSWGAARATTLAPTSHTFFADGARRQHVLRVAHPGTLTVAVAFSA